MDNTKEFRAIELCAGYAGIHLGLKRVIPNLRVVAFSEIELFAIQNLVSKMEKGSIQPTPTWTDLKKFPARPFYSRIRLITAGFPCQPFSNAGNRKGTEDERHLFPYIANTIDIIRPEYVFLENVEGLISTQTLDHRGDIKSHYAALDEEAETLDAKGRYYLQAHKERLHRRLLRLHGISALHYVICRLESLGYQVSWDIFSAAECGAPHQRKRVFILGRLANTESVRGRTSRSNDKQRISGASSGTGQELVHTGPVGSPKREVAEIPLLKLNGTYAWPSRPGEQQHEWEPPRVANSERINGRGERGGNIAEPTGETSGESPQDSNGGNQGDETQSEMGGDPNGYPDWMVSTDSRIDELRLLGNGVVPATVEKAWRTLYARLDRMKDG